MHLKEVQKSKTSGAAPLIWCLLCGWRGTKRCWIRMHKHIAKPLRFWDRCPRPFWLTTRNVPSWTPREGAAFLVGEAKPFGNGNKVFSPMQHPSLPFFFFFSQKDGRQQQLSVLLSFNDHFHSTVYFVKCLSLWLFTKMRRIFLWITFHQVNKSRGLQCYIFLNLIFIKIIDDHSWKLKNAIRFLI